MTLYSWFVDTNTDKKNDTKEPNNMWPIAKISKQEKTPLQTKLSKFPLIPVKHSAP